MFFSQWCPISETWHCASPAPYKVLKTYPQSHARFLRSQMELALLCTFFSMVQLIKYKHSLLIKFLTYQITNLMEIQWNVCCSFVKLAEYNQIQRVDGHCKGLCPSYWMFRSVYPFSNIADVVVSQIVPCPGANLVEKIFEQPIFIVSRSFANIIKKALFKHPPLLTTDALYPRRDFLFRISILQSESVLA